METVIKKIRFSFRSKNQLPFFMIWREYLMDDTTGFRVICAEVIFSTRF